MSTGPKFKLTHYQAARSREDQAYPTSLNNPLNALLE